VKSLLLRVWQRLRGTPGHPARAAAAVAIGLFIGCQPLYGLHLVLVLAICVPLRLDAVLSYLAANISNPFVAPFLIFSEVETGAWLSTGHAAAFDLARARAVGATGFVRQLVIGGVVVGALVAALGFALAWLVTARRSRSARGEADEHTAVLSALESTRRRYAGASAADRHYVAGKLSLDPVFELIGSLPGGFGRVLDLGCGRGQLSIFLLELGRAECVVGVDADARKLAVARAAAPDITFEMADLASYALPSADTVLLIDVLHYLPLREQDLLLQAAAAALSPRGRLLVRELDGTPSARGAVTRFVEWWARLLGVNRGRATHYRPAAEIREVLERAGLCCSIQGASERTPFGNVLLVAGGAPTVNVERSASPSSTRMSAAKA
jgi:uncharacterized protein (DUF2062 family)/SAM-dependent methyltransferase